MPRPHGSASSAIGEVRPQMISSVSPLNRRNPSVRFLKKRKGQSAPAFNASRDQEDNGRRFSIASFEIISR